MLSLRFPLLLASLAFVSLAPAAPPPAAAKIDAAILSALQKAGQKPNPLSTDEEFVRRLYLESAGRIPTSAETLAFLSSTEPDKRAQLIDRLLDSDGYRSQMFNWTADLLRVTDRLQKSGQTFVYQEWIKDEIEQNDTWDKMVYAMLTAQGRLSTSGPAGYLLRDPGMPLDNLSATLTAFLGTNISCAQCHDHPLAPWTQREFYEMAAFFGNVQTYNEKPKVLVRQTVRADPALKNDAAKKAIKRLLYENTAEVVTVPGKQLTFPADYKYKDAKPGENVKPALFAWMNASPKGPAYAVDTSKPEEWRTAFATWMTHPENPRFAANIANRLWKKAFGLAVQEPVTDIDDPAKASNPELLALLTAEMKRTGFDLREFQRTIYNTEAWQRRANVTPEAAAGPYLFAGPLLRRLTAEQAWDSVVTLAIGPGLDRYELHREGVLEKKVIPGEKLTPAAIAAKMEELKKGRRRGNGKAALMGAYEADGQKVRPERIGNLVLARASELPQPSPESHFLRNFGQSDRKTADDSSLEGGIPQALMLMNGDIEKVVGSTHGFAFKAATARASLPEQIESLYLSFLARHPSAPEQERAQQALRDGLVLPDLVWALFNTREFMFVR